MTGPAFPVCRKNRKEEPVAGAFAIAVLSDGALYSFFMAEPQDFPVRQPAVAGAFYPAGAQQCRAVAQSLVKLPPWQSTASSSIGGIVPHAGWICSGAIAGEVIGSLAQVIQPDVVVVFGAVHTPIELSLAALTGFAVWAMPGGQCQIDAQTTSALAEKPELFVIDDRFHRRDHAVEVEVPLIQAVWPDARLLPVEVPLVDSAVEIGRETARALMNQGLGAVFLASSDLTHYGPSYRFVPAGVGMEALNWAKHNDRRLLEVVQNFNIAAVVPEVRQQMNACGGGAIAAMLSACKEAGCRSVRVLQHTNSYETLARVAPQPPVDAVGYAGVLVS
jgi:hypothetical protein